MPVLRINCVHRGAALSAGKIVDGMAVCSFHGLRYDSNGIVKLIPANGKTATVPEQFHTLSYPARDEHGFIWVWYGLEKPDYQQLQWFSDIDDTFVYGTSTQHWKTHYSRAIENQLDVAHLPLFTTTLLVEETKPS